MSFARQLKTAFGAVALSLLAWFALSFLSLRAADGYSKRERSFNPVLGTITAPPLGLGIRDKVFRKTPRRLQRATASATELVYLAPDGSRIYIRASDGYLPDPAADQVLANFLGSLLHNFELDGLHVYVATPSEIPTICGSTAAACYFLDTEQLVVVGEESYGGLPTDYVTAHEYGHHIENHRSNRLFGFKATSWGTKGWASYEGVCPGVLSGRYSLKTTPGYNYFRHPGEAFAEAYAYYHYPGLVPWDWVGSLYPNQGSYDQIELDVREPWTGPERQFRRGRVSRRRDRADTLHFNTPLDGKLILDLYGPRHSDLDLYLYRRHRVHNLKRSVGRGSREKIRYIVCGGYKFDAVVVAFRGGGHYRLRIKRP